jgi:hypothetical protein
MIANWKSPNRTADASVKLITGWRYVYEENWIVQLDPTKETEYVIQVTTSNRAGKN